MIHSYSHLRLILRDFFREVLTGDVEYDAKTEYPQRVMGQKFSNTSPEGTKKVMFKRCKTELYVKVAGGFSGSNE